MKVYYNISIQNQWLDCYTDLPDDVTVASLLKDAYQSHRGETFLEHVSHWPALKAYKTIENVQQRTSMPAYEPLLNDHSSPDKPQCPSGRLRRPSCIAHQLLPYFALVFGLGSIVLCLSNLPKEANWVVGTVSLLSAIGAFFAKRGDMAAR